VGGGGLSTYRVVRRAVVVEIAIFVGANAATANIELFAFDALSDVSYAILRLFEDVEQAYSGPTAKTFTFYADHLCERDVST